ncbi:MAG: serine hydrolase domain-containing protein [Bacteroidota bacterium]
MRNASFFGVLFLFLTGCCMGGLSPKAVEDPYYELGRFMDSLAVAGSFSGSLVVGDLSGIQYEKHAGLATRVWGIPVDQETRFDIASVNKSFVGGLMVLAEEQGKLNLQDRLVDWLSDFNYSGQFNDSISLHQLLTHTSGLPDYDGTSAAFRSDDFRSLKRQHFTTESYVDFISQLEPIGPVGAQFYYSNFAYHLASIVLEQAYKKPFNAILQEQICQPLNLVNTFNATDNKNIYRKVAEGYNPTPVDENYTRNQFIDLTVGRRIFSTATDLFRWGQAMGNEALFSAKAKEKMHQNYVGRLNPQLSYGYGWVVYGKGEQFEMGNLEIDVPYLIHGGRTEGFKAMLVVIDGGQQIVSFLVNHGDQINEMELANQVIQRINE